MAQHLSMVPMQSMRLEQRLTPQLIQSMEILQLPLLALEARVRQELESNPLLEEADAPSGEPAAAPAPEQPAEEPSQATTEAQSFERLDQLSREYDFDPGDTPYGRTAASNGERDKKMEAMANSAARGISLPDYLERQWALMDLSPEVRRAGLEVIRWMDPDGYLRRKSEHGGGDASGGNGSLPLIMRRDTESLERLDDEIAHACNAPLDPGVLEEAIAKVQTIEPRGVGARDLTECLLIQLDALPERHELAELLVENHLLDIAKNRFPQVVRDTGRSMEEVKEALSVVSRLHHHPGLLISPVEVPHVTPDVIVEHTEDGVGYTVRLARGSSARLRISQHYHNMLTDRHGDQGARDFLRKNFEAAKALIDAISFRRERLLEIARIVVERQREFLDYGPQHLKILFMRDIAAELNCDPSTISRTVDGKYMQTPRAIYPLRMFFTGGMETTSGEAISWDAVRNKVKEIIEQEDKSNPLSDDAVAAQLAASGHVNIARRTIAKYRSQLNIPPARQRKQF